jgi:hypothetical protein
MGDMSCAYNFFEGRYPLEDLGIDGRLILKFISEL